MGAVRAQAERRMRWEPELERERMGLKLIGERRRPDKVSVAQGFEGVSEGRVHERGDGEEHRKQQ